MQSGSYGEATLLAEEHSDHPSFSVGFGGTVAGAKDENNRFPSKNPHHSSHFQGRQSDGKIKIEKNYPTLAQELKFSQGSAGFKFDFNIKVPIKFNSLVSEEARTEAIFQFAAKGDPEILRGKDYYMGDISFKLSDSGIYFSADTPLNVRMPINKNLRSWATSNLNEVGKDAVDALVEQFKSYNVDIDKITVLDIEGRGPQASAGLQFKGGAGLAANARLAEIVLRLGLPCEDERIVLECGLGLSVGVKIGSISSRKGKPGVKDEKSISAGVWRVMLSTEDLELPHTAGQQQQTTESSKKTDAFVRGRAKKTKYKIPVKGEKSMTQSRVKEFARNYGFSYENLNQDLKNQLEAILLKLDKQGEILKRQEGRALQAKRMAEAEGALNEIARIGQSFKNPSIIKAASIGQCAVKLGNSILAIQQNIPALKEVFDAAGIFNSALSGLASLNPYITAASAAIQIGFMLFGSKKQDTSAMQVFMIAMQNISRQLEEIAAKLERMDSKLDHLLASVHQIKYSIQVMIEAHSQQIATNVRHAHDGLQEDIVFTRMVLSKLVEENMLITFNSLIHAINEHRIGKRKKATNLNEAYRSLELQWLSATLCGPSFNGVNYVTDKIRQNKNILMEVHEVGEILGYLDQFAKRSLGNQLPQLKKEWKLPHVNLWLYGLQASLAARFYAHSAYGESLEAGEVRGLQEIVTGTLEFIQILSDNRGAIFDHLIKQYIVAEKKLKSNMEKHFKKELAKTFTLRECIEKEWIKLEDFAVIKVDHSVLTRKLGKDFKEKIINHPNAGAVRVPLSMLLANKLFNFSFDMICNIERVPAREMNRTAVSKRRYGTALITHSVVANLQLLLKNQTDQEYGYPIVEINSQTTSERLYYSEENLDSIDAYGAKMQNEAAKLNALSDADVFNETVITTIQQSRNYEATSQNLTHYVTQQLLANPPHKELLVKDLRTLFNEYQSAYQAALKQTENVTVKKGSALNKIMVIHVLAGAYGALIGLSNQKIKQVQSLMKTKIAEVFQDIGHTAQLDLFLKGLKIDESSLRSEIVSKMHAAQLMLDNFCHLACLQKVYLTVQAEWEKNFKCLKFIEGKFNQLTEINNIADPFFSHENVQLLLQGKEALKERLHISQKKLIQAQAQLQKWGVFVTHPSLIDINSIPPTSTPTHTQKNARTIGQLKDMPLVEIIETSQNPYADVKIRLSAFSEKDFEQIAKLVKQEHHGKTVLHAVAEKICSNLEDDSLVDLLKIFLSYDSDTQKKNHHDKKAIELLPVKAIKARALLSSREAWQVAANELTENDKLSIYRVVRLIEEGASLIEDYPQINQAVILFGETGAGKSTLANFMHGSEYAESINEETGDAYLVWSGGKKEVTKTSELSTSETLYPTLVSCDTYTLIDMPGFEGTAGKEDHISTGVTTGLIAEKIDAIKAIVIVCKHDELYQTKKLGLRKTLAKVGLMIKAHPEAIKQLLFVVTKGRDKHTAPDTYERQFCTKLKKWYEDEFASLLDGSEAQLAIKNLLAAISPQHIVLATPDNPTARKRLNQRLMKIDQCSKIFFNFDHYHASKKSFENFLNKIDQYRLKLRADVKIHLSALCSVWEQQQLSIDEFACLELSSFDQDHRFKLLSSLVEFEHTTYKELQNLFQAYMIELSSKIDKKTFYVSSDEMMAEKAAYLVYENSVNADFFECLDKISKIIKRPSTAPKQYEEVKSATHASYKVPSTHFNKKKTNSTTFFSPQTPINLLQTYEELVKCYHNKQYEDVIIKIKEILSALKTTHPSLIIGKFFSLLASCYCSVDKNDEATIACIKALPIYYRYADKEENVKLVKKYHLCLSKLAKNLDETFNNALNMFKEKKFYIAQHTFSYVLEKMLKEQVHATKRAACYGYLALCCEALKELDQAVYYLQASLQLQENDQLRIKLNGLLSDRSAQRRFI